MPLRRLRLTRRTVPLAMLLALGSACERPDTTPGDAAPTTPADAWVEGLQAARAERASLTEEMQALFEVSLETRAGSVVELTLANLSDRSIVEYGGLLHLRNPEGERVCTLWLSERADLRATEASRRSFDVDGAFAADTTQVSLFESTWSPYRLVFEDGEEMARPWPTQSWWPWCQSFLSARWE